MSGNLQTSVEKRPEGKAKKRKNLIIMKMVNIYLFIIINFIDDLSEEGMSWDELEEIAKKSNIL